MHPTTQQKKKNPRTDRQSDRHRRRKTPETQFNYFWRFAIICKTIPAAAQNTRPTLSSSHEEASTSFLLLQLHRGGCNAAHRFNQTTHRNKPICNHRRQISISWDIKQKMRRAAGIKGERNHTTQQQQSHSSG